MDPMLAEIFEELPDMFDLRRNVYNPVSKTKLGQLTVSTRFQYLSILSIFLYAHCVSSTRERALHETHAGTKLV